MAKGITLNEEKVHEVVSIIRGIQRDVKEMLEEQDGEIIELNEVTGSLVRKVSNLEQRLELFEADNMDWLGDEIEPEDSIEECECVEPNQLTTAKVFFISFGATLLGVLVAALIVSL